MQDWLADKDRQMQSDLRERLKLVSEEAQRLYARLVQLTVFAALGSKVLNPRQALHEFGLEVEVADRVTFDWNHFVGVSVAMLAVLFTATVTYFWLGTPAGSDSAGSGGGGEVMLWTLCGLSLLVGGLAGGYAVGLFMLNNKLGRRRGATKLAFSNVDMAISAATAWATSVIAYAVTGLLLGLGQLAPTGWMWGFVPGVFGATLALAAHRIKAGRPIWPLRYVVQLGAATVLAVLVTLLFTVEFDPRRLVADPGFVFYVMATSLVCAIWFGLLLRTWHRQHVAT